MSHEILANRTLLLTENILIFKIISQCSLLSLIIFPFSTQVYFISATLWTDLVFVGHSAVIGSSLFVKKNFKTENLSVKLIISHPIFEISDLTDKMKNNFKEKINNNFYRGQQTTTQYITQSDC